MLPSLLGLPTLGLSLAAAYVTCLIVLRGSDPQLRRHASKLLPLLASAGLLGGRLLYLLEFSSFSAKAALDFTQGLSFFGTLAGILVAAVAYCKLTKLPLRLLADGFAVCVPAQAAARIGCFLAGDGCYGRPTDLWCGMSFPHGICPTTQAVHPVPVYEAIACICIWLLLIRIRTSPHPFRMGGGIYFAVYAVGYATVRFALEYCRTNPKYGWLTAPQYGCVILLLTGILTALTFSKPDHEIT